MLMPPSETKRTGGIAVSRSASWAEPQRPSALQFPALCDVRERVADVLGELATDEARTAKALKVSQKLAGSVCAVNGALASSPLLPAVERYTGLSLIHI